ncbi:MAG: hypothetical protein ABS53_12610 [Hydrogenophaga sp. SCN 70-13]|uniref:anthrone oxygenase family protein n=1 Tax=Hydrogenophaga TaxID=47420 RepID=UPI000868B155|nr:MULTISPECIES: anthrone oxygenase family protein [unclassified Hydrogenophaga]MBN9372746.1 DUF1772 domain-containing protein [Hydrogenophaga sp.]ODT30049.1 MAG: hypothetical protein ABS53_12610 [Hydrogenophaga sp. SCN 70-13]OJV71552.1 MAG: hypothetical protein BGO22_02525 [Hydrogenophaga sp. 70-12]
MATLLQGIAIAAIVGGGLVTGLLYAFSLVTMRALLEQPAEAGMSTMQSINRLIIRPLFLLPFLGTAVLCLLLLIGALWQGGAGAIAWCAGALAYLIGPLGVTMACNVPLNDRLARTDLREAPVLWPRYVRDWLRWNHVRSALGAVSLALLALGLALKA